MSMPPGWANELSLSDVVLNPGNYRGGIFSGFNLLYGLDNELNHLRAYNECAPLKSIVSKRAKAFNVAHIDVINTNTEKPATGPQAAAFRQILKRPNPLQTQKQFLAQHNTYLDIFGYCPVFIIRPFGMPAEVTAIWNIPPWLFNVQFTGFWLQQTTVEGIFKGYTMQWSTGNIFLPSENLKLIFDDGFGTDMDINLCIPDSRLRSLEYPVSNIVAALKGTNSLIVNKGPTGILSNQAKDSVGHIPLPDGEKDAVQKDFRRYGITGQEYQVIITEANLSYQQIGSPMTELQLPETIQNSVNMLCDAYGYYPELMARSKDTTFANKEKAEKMLYTGTIIPESESRLEQLSNALMGQGNNLRYFGSFAHASALQAEAKETADARKSNDIALEKEFKNNVITLDQWLTVLEMPLRTDGKGDKYYYELINEGWSFGDTSVQAGDVKPETDGVLPAAAAA
jgi:hypothetical protein